MTNTANPEDDRNEEPDEEAEVLGGDIAVESPERDTQGELSRRLYRTLALRRDQWIPSRHRLRKF